MSILINKDTNIICQGITGKAGKFHSLQCLQYGTKLVAGVTPKKGGTDVEGVPVYNSVGEAASDHKIDATMIYVPAPFALSAIKEAVDAGVKLIIVITEGIPVLDMVEAKSYAADHNARIIGPNCPGIITSEECKIGIMPGYIHKKGRVGVISRSGTLTYEAVWQLTQAGLGQTTCIGIGGDPVIGSSFIDLLKLFKDDSETEGVLLLGEIGGSQEEEAAQYIQSEFDKPAAAFIAGQTAPKGKRMGHAGAIISGSSGTAEEKYKVLNECGISIVRDPSQIGATMKSLLN